ncbi:MAG: DUF6116 family protein [Gemmatimonadota bacterium]
MNPLRRIFERTLGRFLSRLRFPQLFVLTVVVFLVDLAVPDAIPFVDEILLGLGSLVLGSLKERAGQREEQGRGGEGSDGVNSGKAGDPETGRIEEKSSREDAS